MRRDEFLDLLGGVDDKFYREAMGEEPLEAVPVIVSKKRGGVLRAAAVFILGLGIAAAAGLLIYHSGIISEHGQEPPFEQTAASEEAPKPSEITREDIDYCLNYTMEAQNLLNGTSAENIPVITLDTLSHFLIDLNFDGTDEILVIDFGTRCPVFIFEMKDGEPVFNGSIVQDIRFDIDKYKFSDIAVYEGGEEKYYYFYLTFEDNACISAKIAAAIKYDGETYYPDYLLSYGIIRSEAGWREFPFFRRGWDIPFDGTDTFSSADYDQMRYEEFKELWEQYPALPAVNLSEYAEKISDHCDMTYNGIKYEYNNDNWDCLIIDGTVYSLDGKTEWDAYDKNGIYLPSAEAMREFGSLEYLDKFGNADIFNLFFYNDSDMYRYGNNILVVSQTYPDLFFDNAPDYPSGTVILDSDNGDSGKFPKVPGIEYKQKDYYRVATYSVCGGHWKYPEFDPDGIPDIKGSSNFDGSQNKTVLNPSWSGRDITGSGNFDDSKGLTALEQANYSVAYECYLWTCLYSETVGDYRFDLVAYNVSTDKANDPDMLYCSEACILIFNINNPEQRVGIIKTIYNKMPVNSDFSDYSAQVYDLRDGIVIYSYEENSPMNVLFYTIKPFADEEALYPLVGDYSSLRETKDGVTQVQKPNVRFTADPETNTLYYEDNAYTVDFTKAGRYDENDRMLTCFTVWRPGGQLSSE